ncbi:nuclease [Haematobacter massiliensis]|uniref:Nuclease n=1 Tax=Haematobacter massiliensis TaxID=195105 RepID=A0A086Y0F2_9RHOB|nr:VRR-NUC domain-containing protein [Haematobacter massiliensis]KFI27752.1 nuclease [Haematobacter massiliensis]OWJ82732.1 VRR-NUC domain-containing protein [Haematobacter massiliensis]
MPGWTDREGPIHRDVLRVLRDRVPDAIVHHSPNEFGMSGAAIARQIAKHKNMGMVPGFPDLVVFAPEDVMFFEVKAEGGTLTGHQKTFRDHAEGMGYRFAVVRSADDAKAALSEWGY